MRRNTMRIAVAALAIVAVAVSSGCTDSTDSSTQQPVEATASQSKATPTESRSLTKAGVTVLLPRDCRITAAGRTAKASRTLNCSGLRRLKLAKVSPVEDLIRPGIHRRRGEWVGLRVVDASYVYAVAEERDMLQRLLRSAEPSRS